MFLLNTLLVFTATVLNCLQGGNGAKILSISFVSTRSHKITYEPLLEALAAKGHEVSVVSPIPVKKSAKNIHEILTIDVEKIRKGMPNMFEAKEKNQKMNPFSLFPQVAELCSQSLDLPQVRALEGEKFDLIFVQALLNECALAFAWTFKTNIILISPLSIPSGPAALYGNPSPSSFVPSLLIGYTDKMTFYERTVNFIVETGMLALVHFVYKPSIEAAYREKLGADLPSIEELFASTSLILSNSHFSIGTIRPFLPDIIEVGGMHCRSAQPLPKSLEDFVSSSGDDGFILFSMGSILKTSDMQEEKRRTLLSVFASLKQKVLWKWETEEMLDLPKNVKLSKWLPQQDVLGHTKIRAFITHGGFGSTTEAVYHGVPLIGLPMFGDQTLNMQMAETAGFGITLDFNTFTQESLLQAINQILNDATYKRNATAISNVFRDQAEHPLDRAVFWSEYVIRHSGARHLRSGGRYLNSIQYHSIDVIGLLSAALLLSLWLIWKSFNFMYYLICNFFFTKSKPKVNIPKKRE